MIVSPSQLGNYKIADTGHLVAKVRRRGRCDADAGTGACRLPGPDLAS